MTDSTKEVDAAKVRSMIMAAASLRYSVAVLTDRVASQKVRLTDQGRQIEAAIGRCDRMLGR